MYKLKAGFLCSRITMKTKVSQAQYLSDGDGDVGFADPSLLRQPATRGSLFAHLKQRREKSAIKEYQAKMFERDLHH